MKCEECGKKLKVVRRCRQVRMRCEGCKREFRIHEIAHRLDETTEELLARYTTIIYD